MKNIIYILFLFASFGNAQIINSYAYTSGGGVSYILDTYSAETAFSFQKLKTTATNCCIIRRNSDDAETTIVLESTGSISLSSTVTAGGTLGTWIGANNAYVKTMIDQSGNANDWNSIVLAEQPLLISAGVINLDASGNVSMNMDNTDDVMKATGLGTTSTNTMFTVFETSDTLFSLFNRTGFSSGFFLSAIDGNATTGIFNNVGAPTFYVNEVEFTGTTFDESHTAQALGSSALLSAINLDVSVWGGLMSLSGKFGGAWQFQGNVAELIKFTTDESSNRVSIETDITSRYLGI